MKKIITILISILIFTPNVLAEEFFWSDKKIANLEQISEEKRFKFYKEEKEGEYIRKGEKDDRYQYEDDNDLKYVSISDYKDNCLERENVKIEYKNVYAYKIIPKAKYLYLDNIIKELYIKKIEIYNGNEKINFDLAECKNCDNLNIKPNGYMLIEFDEEQVVGNLKINIETTNDELLGYYGYFYSQDMIFIKNIAFNTTKSNYTLDNYNYMIANFKDTYYSEEVINKDHINYPLGKKQMCIEKEARTFRYNILKKYYDDNYYVNLEDNSYIKDDKDYITFYKYSIEENTEKIENDNYEEYYVEEKPVDTGYNGNKKNEYHLKIAIICSVLFSIIFILKKNKIKKKMSM